MCRSRMVFVKKDRQPISKISVAWYRCFKEFFLNATGQFGPQFHRGATKQAFEI